MEPVFSVWYELWPKKELAT